MIFLCAALSALGSGVLYAQMSDDAVYQYAEEGLKAGKSEETLAKELAAKGVTQTQAQRIKERIERDRANTNINTQAEDFDRMRSPSEEGSGTAAPARTQEVRREDMIYGMELFSQPDLNFSPSENIATPEYYRLGPGDEIIVDIWGTNQDTIREKISPEGTVNITSIGPVYLNGKTVKEAELYLRKQLNRIYSVYGEGAQSDIKLSLGNTRSIVVNIIGEVKSPGTYYISSFSSIFHALFKAGGINELGDLRYVKLMRGGKSIADFDLYKLLLKGDTGSDISLNDNDVIIVQPYSGIVKVSGKVKRPMRYEIREGEKLQDILDYCGGFTADAYKANIGIIRMENDNYHAFTVDDKEYASFELKDGDVLEIGGMNDRFKNKLEIQGAVFHPGTFQLGNGIATLKSLIEKAGGLTGDAFTGRSLIYREQDNYTTAVIPVDLEGIINGRLQDIPLKNNDRIFISTVNDILDRGVITIEGEVAMPGTYDFSDNTSVEDIIIMAGGLRESASTAKIDVSRRLKDASSTKSSEKWAEVFSFEISEDLKIQDGGDEFILKPYDHIYVRKSPAYMPQTHAIISGEIVFPGRYVITSRNERISDLVAKAGGITDWAYVKGARLRRVMSKDEQTRAEFTERMITNAKDSINAANLDMDEHAYYVGINLEKALENPGSDYDLVLIDGDELDIPLYNNTVRISGNVMFPNTVTYNPGMTVKKYVNLAGGYGFRAKRGKAYIVYINGNVARAKSLKSSIVEPGCEIIVPQKNDGKENFQEIMSLGTTTASLATMIATIGNIIVNGKR